MNMTDERRHRRTHLFTVRLWVERITPERAEVRGRVQHVLSGNARYFRTGQELTNFFEQTLQEVEEPYSAPGCNDDSCGGQCPASGARLDQDKTSPMGSHRIAIGEYCRRCKPARGCIAARMTDWLHELIRVLARSAE